MTATTEDRLLSPAEVAALFRVDPKTVSRWAQQGHLPSFRTPGGHRRFRASDIEALRGHTQDPEHEAVENLKAAARRWRNHIAAAERAGATVRSETRDLITAIDALPTTEDTRP